MNRQLLINTIASILVFTTVLTNLHAQTDEESGFGRKEHIELAAKAIKTLKITNKHGNISIIGWDRDSISIETLINVNSDGPKAADEVLNFISIKRSNLGDQLLFRTQFNSEFFSNYPFSISYTIHAPKYMNLDISNSIGNVLIHEIDGQVDMNQAYGNMHLNQLGAPPSIQHHLNLSFVEGKIEGIGAITPLLLNSNLSVKNLTSCKGETKYSLLEIDNCQSIQLKSTTDRITINQADSVSINGIQVLAKVNDLSEFGFFEIEEGHLTVQANNQVQHLSIGNHSTHTTIGLPSNFTYLLNGEVTDGLFTHPQKNQLQLINEEEKVSFSGKVGPSPQASAEIIVFNSSSELTFQTY
ncbi:MAG: hypothetical protein JEZ14_24120 [Marinilabiliaceae bacterium]|nr:hypothetical protein [Marinilabiliaceae bacterium]